jgi:hypothetical protein
MPYNWSMAKTKNDSELPRRETAYPYYPFRTSLKLAEAVKSCGGKREGVPKDVLADALKMGESSPSFAQVLASAKCFGMIEGRGSYRLTEDGVRYFFPTEDNESLKAKLSFFARPTAFRLLVDRFDGDRLPEAPVLANILLRHGKVPKSWVGRAASLFMDAVNELGLIDEGGRLRYAVALKKATRDSPVAPAAHEAFPEKVPFHQREIHEFARPTVRPGQSSDPQESSPAPATGSEPRPEYRTNVWSFREAGGMVRVESPDPLPRVLWERLKRYVDVLEPSGEQVEKKTEGTQPVGE